MNADTPSTPSPRPRLAARLALALASSALTIALVECSARVAVGDDFVSGLPVGRPDRACAVHDPDLGWRNMPGAVARVKAPRFSYRLRINSKGLRDVEHPYEKEPGTFRIALLGDSIAWGWGVDDGRCFADLIEPRLGVEVINLGVPGYSTDQQLLTLERDGLRYEPDLVLLCFVLNDVLGNLQETSQGRNKPRFVRRDEEWRVAGQPVAPTNVEDEVAATTWLQRLYWHSALLQAFHPPDAEAELAAQAPAAARSSPAPDRDDPVSGLTGQIAHPRSVTAMLLQRLRETCAARGLPLVAFNVAHHHDQYLYWPNNQRRPPAPPNGRPFITSVSEQLALAGRRYGFATLSVDHAMFEQTGEGHVLTCGDGHLNELGNEVVARRLVEELTPIIAACRAGTYRMPVPRAP